MEDEDFEVQARWKEEVYYWEGLRGFLFDAGWGVEPPVLYVPPADEWDASTPDWMHGRRDLILARLDGYARHRLVEGPYPGPGRTITRQPPGTEAVG